MRHGDGGKRSDPRPLSVTLEEFGSRFDAIFGRRKPAPIPAERLAAAVAQEGRIAPAHGLATLTNAEDDDE